MSRFSSNPDIVRTAALCLSSSAALIGAPLSWTTTAILVRAGIRDLDEIRDWDLERLAGLPGMGCGGLPELLEALGRPWEACDLARIALAHDRAMEADHIARAIARTGDPLAWVNRRREYQARSDARKAARKAAEAAGVAPRRRARRGAHRRGYTPPA